MTVKNKIFAIGLPKTGTVSLNTALQKLGINSIHYPIDKIIPRLQNSEYACLNEYQAYVNCGEWHFAAIDRHYPDSKFIYTWREYEDWIHSVKKHIENYEVPDTTETVEEDDFL